MTWPVENFWVKIKMQVFMWISLLIFQDGDASATHLIAVKEVAHTSYPMRVN